MNERKRKCQFILEVDSDAPLVIIKRDYDILKRMIEDCDLFSVKSVEFKIGD